MYLGNANLRGHGESVEMTQDIIQEWMRCKEDIIYFAENYFYTLLGDDGMGIIPLRDYQKKILKQFVDPIDDRRYCVLMASRQASKTTLAAIYILHYVIFNADKRAAVLANKEDSAIGILERIKFSYSMLPMWLQAGIEEWNKKSITLDNGCTIIAAATSSDGIRSKSISLLYLDEYAFVPQNVVDEFMASVYPTITSFKESKIIVTSTPNGLNHFYNIWEDAVLGKNNYYPMKVNWFEVPGRDEEWKRRTIADIGIIKFRQEYSCEFLGSVSTLIDSEVLEKIKTIDPVEVKWSGVFQIFEAPRRFSKYVIGVDIGKGINQDYTVAQVIRIDNEFQLEQVALYRQNNMNPVDFCNILESVCEYYNHAALMIESNGVGEIVCYKMWNELEYDNMINPEAVKGRLGILSSWKSKLNGNIFLKRYIEEGWLKLNDKRTVFELSRYREIRMNVFSCQDGEHDDCVTSLIWAVHFLNTDYYEDKGRIPKPGLSSDDKYYLEGYREEEDLPPDNWTPFAIFT